MSRLPSLNKINLMSKQLYNLEATLTRDEFLIQIRDFIKLIQDKRESLVWKSYKEELTYLEYVWTKNLNLLKSESESDFSLNWIQKKAQAFKSWLSKMIHGSPDLITHYASQKLEKEYLEPTRSSNPETNNMLVEMRK